MSHASPIYAIGDIHGQLTAFENALSVIEKDAGSEAEIVLIGDLADRGPESRRVIELVMELRRAGKNMTVIKGNHDRMFDYFMQSPPRHDPSFRVGYHWFHEALGGKETMASYGVAVDETMTLNEVHERALEVVPEAHVAFLRSLPLSHQSGNIFFAHAGIRPNVPLDRQEENDLVWIRQEFLNFTDPHPKLIVHGHTSINAPTHYGNRINLDGGAGYGRPLIPVAIEGRGMRLLL